MPLNTFRYLLLFLPIVVLGAGVLRARAGSRAAYFWVLACSLVFYAINSAATLPILLGSILVNYAAGKRLAGDDSDRERRGRLLTAAIACNLLLLAAFKYAAPMMALVAGEQSPWTAALRFGFPLGLSFFTLTQVMYLVDCYEGLVVPRGFWEYAGFVTFFPNIVAGPLLRARLFFGQATAVGSTDGLQLRLTQACALIALGLCKKVALGDSFARLSSIGYASVPALSTAEAWITTFAATLEVYFDFSGYSDIAFGSASLLGLTLVRNFNAPYLAVSISDFWRRWHISLSDFITTYLYTPILRRMGRATVRTSAIATLIAMVIAGTWHGASWNYILFGFLHGGALAGYQYWKKRKTPLPNAVAIPLTFLFVNIAFITVKARDVRETLTVARQLLPHANLADLTHFTAALTAADLRLLAVPVLVGIYAAFSARTAEQVANTLRPSVRSDALIIALLLAAYICMSSNTVSEFRYRQF